MGSTFKQVEKTYDLGNGREHLVTYHVPQVEDYDEACTFFGSETVLLDRINTIIERSAMQNGNLKFKEAPEQGWTPETIEETTAKALEAVRGYTASRGGPGKAAKAEAFDQLMEIATKDQESWNAMSKEEILAKLQEFALRK